MIGIPKNIENEDSAITEIVMMEYAAGNLSPAQMLVMDHYVEINDDAKKMCRNYLAIGGGLIDNTDDCSELSNLCFDNIMNKIETNDSDRLKHSRCSLTNYIHCNLNDLQWNKLTAGIEYYDIDIPINKGEKAQLLKMAPGKSVLEHSHDGMELTLVLDGAFHDDAGTYSRGDLAIESGNAHKHKPVADEVDGCICLAVTSAPLHFTGLFGRLISPFLKQ